MMLLGGLEIHSIKVQNKTGDIFAYIPKPSSRKTSTRVSISSAFSSISPCTLENPWCQTTYSLNLLTARSSVEDTYFQLLRQMWDLLTNIEHSQFS